MCEHSIFKRDRASVEGGDEEPIEVGGCNVSIFDVGWRVRSSWIGGAAVVVEVKAAGNEEREGDEGDAGS